MKKYKIEIETLTPIHIGNGNTYGLLDFMIYEKEEKYFLYRFDLNSLIRNLNGDLQNKLFQIIEENDFVKLKDFFSENYENLEDKIKEISKSKLQVSKYVFERWKEKLDLKLENMNGDSLEAKKNNLFNKLGSFQVSEFINQRGKYYIPGSSLKGAIRNAILDGKDDNFSGKNIPKDPFKSIIISDSNFFSDVKLGEKYRAGAGTYLEYIDKGNKLYPEMILKEFLDGNDYRKLGINDEKDLVKKINEFTKVKLERYIDGLNNLVEKYEDEDIQGKIEQFKNLKEKFEEIKGQIEKINDNECILSLGFGGGFWFKTYRDIEYKNIKLGDNFILNEKHPKFCTIHWHWEGQKNFNLVDFDGFDYKKKEEFIKSFGKKHNSIAGTQVKNFNDNDIQIPRTWWRIQDENLGFIKLTFTD